MKIKNNSGTKTTTGASSVNPSSLQSDAAEILIFTLEYLILLGICVALTLLLR